MICIIEAHFVTGLVWAALGYEMATGIVGEDAGGGFTRQGLFGILHQQKGELHTSDYGDDKSTKII